MATTETLPANQFRVGETWASPRGQHWYVMRIDPRGRAVLRNVANPKSKQYRGTLAVGNNVEDAWLRIDPPLD
jgi:hypothetical protein